MPNDWMHWENSINKANHSKKINACTMDIQNHPYFIGTLRHQTANNINEAEPNEQFNKFKFEQKSSTNA
jgi:hypothetical protein